MPHYDHSPCIGCDREKDDKLEGYCFSQCTARFAYCDDIDRHQPTGPTHHNSFTEDRHQKRRRMFGVRNEDTTEYIHTEDNDGISDDVPPLYEQC